MNPIENLLFEKKGTIIDVRSTVEYLGGHAIGSVNVPLQEMLNRMDELKEMTQPLIMCCESGHRSGMATEILKRNGYETFNAGSWVELNKILINQ
jgi:phage shock protein E